MLRNWTELKGYVVAQGLVTCDSFTDGDPNSNVQLTAEGAQVLFMLLAVKFAGPTVELIGMALRDLYPGIMEALENE